MMKSKYLLIFLLCSLCNVLFSQSFERQILSSSDDAEEKFDGTDITTTSSDIELVYDSWNDQGLQVIGLRFDEIAVPANSTILNAYIQFTADGDYTGDVTLTIKGENSADSAPFSDSFNNISGRSQTTSNVVWTSIPSWEDDEDGSAQRSPDLSEIVTEVMAISGWNSNNPITFIITGTGGEDQRRRAFSFDESSTKAAKLYIEFESNSQIDMAIVSCATPGEYNYPDSEAKVALEITSFGNLIADDYSIALYLDDNLISIEAGITNVEVGQTILFDFTESIDLGVVGDYELRFELMIEGDENPLNNTLTKTINVIDEVDPLLFDQGSSWRYRDVSADPGPAWNTLEYDDSSWKVGIGQFGFGEGDEQTSLKNGLVSYYFRKQIEVSDVNELSDLYMHLVHDDAAIVYINGEILFRTELMPAGTITHNTAARQSSNSSTQNEFYTYKINSNLLVTGENIIAVSVRNRSAADGDLSFDCFISNTFLYDQDGPYVYYGDDELIVEEVTPEGLVLNSYNSAEGLELTCELPHMGTSFSFTLKPDITIEPSYYEATPSKLLAISDFDGHIEGLTMVLRGEGVIDEAFNWTYGDGHLVISGDLFDRGFHVTECMWLLYKLESEAEAAGGKLHLIIGNHEIFNLTDDWRYVEVKYFNNAHLMSKRMSRLYHQSSELGRWLRSKNIIEKIGEHTYLHGGISPEVSALNLTYDEINEYGRIVMNDLDCPNTDCTTVTGSDGIYWYRGMVDEELTQVQVDNFLDGFETKRVIIGHTKDNTIRSLYTGRVIAIDMYHINNFEAGFMEALQFELGCFYVFNTNGTNQNYTLLNECDDTIDNVLELNGAGQMKIYPNPSSSKLNIELPEELDGKYSYTIVTVDGKLVAQGEIDSKLSTIHVGKYSAGKYIFTLSNSERIISGHIILKN